MPVLVALRKESVDRNHYCADCASGNPTSLSARRAWIEISIYKPTIIHVVCRSPQGERG